MVKNFDKYQHARYIRKNYSSRLFIEGMHRKKRAVFLSHRHALMNVFKFKDKPVSYIITIAQKSVKRKFGDSKLSRKAGNYTRLYVT